MKDFLCGLRDGAVIVLVIWCAQEYVLLGSYKQRVASEHHDLRVRIEALEDRIFTEIRRNEH